MAVPTEWKNIPEYAAHVATLLPQRPLAARLTKDLRSLHSPFTKTRISLPLHCTACWSELDATCPVVANLLPVLNEWLECLGVEVYEFKPGKLALCAIQNDTQAWVDTWEGTIAVVLLHCLLTRHRCLEVFDAFHFVVNSYTMVFSEALRKSEVKILRVTKCQVMNNAALNLMNSLCGSESLTELTFKCAFHFSNINGVELAVASIVAESKSLRLLHVAYCSLFRGSAVALIESLKKNESIQELVVDEHVLTDKQGTAFSNFLRCNKKLRKLTIVSKGIATAWKMDVVFNALLDNSTLNSLRLKYFDLDLVTALAFVRLITCNKALLEVEFSYCSWFLDAVHELPCDQSGSEDPIYSYAVGLLGSVSQALPFMLALNRTSSLRRLSLRHIFHEEENHQLLAEVANCRSLEQIYFDRVHCKRSFYSALQSTHAFKKVRLGTCVSKVDDFVWALQSYGDLLTMGTYQFNGLDQQAFHKVVAALPLHDHITGLDLRLNYKQYSVTKEDATLIANYLSSTRVLKNVCMRFDLSTELAHHVVEGLCKNDTIEKLSIEDWQMADDDIGRMCSWVAASRKVYHLSYVCAEQRAYGMLVSILARLLPSNCTLTSVHIVGYMCNNNDWRAVKQLKRRNLSLVECAVSFLLGSTLKRAASAFERVWWHPQVTSRAQYELQLGPAEVNVRLQECKRRLQMDFWQITGIVRSELVCHERADQQKQISQLGIDAWLSVRAFLTISDVLDELPKKPSRKRMRS